MKEPGMTRLGIVLVGLAVVLLPWCAGGLLWLSQAHGIHESIASGEDRDGEAATLAYKGVQVDWTLYPDWEFKPLLGAESAYFVFVFHYTNTGDRAIYLMPSYTLASPGETWQAANEEIASYIEDQVEDDLGVRDEPGLLYSVPAHSTRHYIAVFSQAPDAREFYVDVDIWHDRSLRIRYARDPATSDAGTWNYLGSAWVAKYRCRG